MQELNFTHAYENANRLTRNLRNVNEGDWDACVNEKSQEFFRRISKPCKDSLLHDVIRCQTINSYEYLSRKWCQDSVAEFVIALEDSGIDLPDWLNEDDVDGHTEELYSLLVSASEQEVQATFHLLFSDRNFLYEFQTAVSEIYIEDMKLSEHPEILKRDGVLKRATYIPEWLKSAVFHRDKGRCQMCWKDLTGLLIPLKDYQLDHMVPLASSGTNDATNFQLICSNCNLEKGATSVVQPHKIFTYW
jgi:hypothetical protein